VQLNGSKTVVETFLHFIQDWVFNRKISVAQRVIWTQPLMRKYLYHVKTTQIMKTIVTFIFIIFVGTSAMAQGTGKEVKVQTTSIGVELNINIQENGVQGKEVARLYMFKNSRVKKALKFKTKRNASKIA